MTSASLQTMYACLHTHTWDLNEAVQIYIFCSVSWELHISFSRENINIYNTSLVWTFIQFVCAVSFSIEIWIESQPYCSTYHVKIGYLSVTLLSSCKFTMHLHANFKKVVSVHLWLKRYSNHLLMRTSWYISSMRHTLHLVI